MNTEDKDIKEEVVEQEESTKTEETTPIEEKESANKEDTPKKEKKHSNKKTALIVIGPFILVCLGIILYTGAWNPFKSETVEEKAVKEYEEAYTVPESMWKEMNPEDEELDKNTSAYRDIQAEFGPNGRFPYGFEILEDNGNEGKNGLLKSMVTANTAYYDKYGFDYTIYYMKNEDYAKEKYIGLKNGDDGLNDFRKEYEFSNGKININQRASTGLTTMTVKIGTVVYYFEGYAENWEKTQALFDKLGIDFSIPNLKNLKK